MLTTYGLCQQLVYTYIHIIYIYTYIYVTFTDRVNDSNESTEENKSDLYMYNITGEYVNLYINFGLVPNALVKCTCFTSNGKRDGLNAACTYVAKPMKFIQRVLF